MPVAEDFRVRLAHEDDAFDILVVRAASWRAAYSGILPARHLAKLTTRWDRTFPSGTWVLERERLLVAYCITSCDDLDRVRPAVEISELYVFPDFWRTGAGSTLLDAVLHEIKTRGAREATLEVLSANTRGLAFYQAKGFHHVPHGDRTVDVEGRKLGALHFRRHL